MAGLERFTKPIHEADTSTEVDARTFGRYSVNSKGLYHRQVIHFLVFNLGAALAAIAALVLSWKFGFRAVDIVLLIFFYFLTMAGSEIGFHRCFAHKAFKAPPLLRKLLAIFGMMAGQGPTAYWIANHRRHHAFSDREGDPHSPADGIWHAHLGWVLDRTITLTPRFARDILADDAIKWADRYYFVWLVSGVVAPGVIAWVIDPTAYSFLLGFLWGGLRLFLIQQATFFVNSGCHAVGERLFNTGDRSTNVAWMSIFSLGGSLHNSHHAFPRSATTALRRGAFDPSESIIRAFEKLAIASDVVIPSHEELLAKAGPGERDRIRRAHTCKSYSRKGCSNS
jgi:stearoyl-CoA desaturase (delta-9 desaturase)